jgi:hypothetical protein
MATNTSQGYGVAPPPQSSSDAATNFQKFDSYPWARDRSFLVSRVIDLMPGHSLAEGIR